MTPTEQNDTKELRKAAEPNSEFDLATEHANYRAWMGSIQPFAVASQTPWNGWEARARLAGSQSALLDRLERAEADLAAEKRKTLELSRVYEERGRQIERLELRDSRAEAALNAERVNLNAGAKEAVNQSLTTAAAGAVPAGFRLVPVEPTQEMVAAAFAGMIEDQDLNRQIKRREAMAETYRKMIAAAPSAPVAAQAEPVEVRIRDGRVWIVKGIQSFMLAYDDDDAEEREWYADHLRAVLSSITPDVKTATPPAPMQEAGKDAWEYSFIHSSALGRGDEEVGQCLTYDEKTAFGVGCIKQRKVSIRAIATSKEEA